MENNFMMDAKAKKVSTPNSTSLSTPLIMIDSISIDLTNETKEKEMGSCPHFSIRGYAAEMRKKDKKLCWPFPDDNKQNKPEEHIYTLPPLQTTQSRWWRCENCRREMDHRTVANETVTIPNGNDDEVACSTCIGRVKNSRFDANQKISRRKRVAEKIDRRLKPKSCTVPLEPNCNGAMVDTGKSDCGTSEAIANEHSIKKLDCQVKDASAHPSLDSDKHENLPGNDLIDDFDEDVFASHRQKPRKIRLLSDLLEASGNSKTSHNTENPHSRSELYRQGWDKILHIGDGFKDKSKKRKMGHDGNVTLLETSPINCETKKNQISPGGCKSNYKEIDRNHILDKYASKKRHSDDHHNHILKNKKQNAGSVDITSLHQNLFPVQESGAKSSLCKKKNKIPQVEDFQTVLMPWNYELLRKNSITRQNRVNKNARPEAQVPIFSYEDFLATQQSKRSIAPSIERPTDFLLPERKNVGSKYIGESSGSYELTESALPDKAVGWDFGAKAGPGMKSLVSEKLIGPFRAEGQEFSTKRLQGGQRPDKLSEQRATDDIPMEIVELLAKRLHSAENNPSPFPTLPKPQNGKKIIAHNAQACGEIKSSQMVKVHSAKSQSGIARKNIIALDENLQWANPKPVSSFSHMSLQEGSTISKRLGAYSTGAQQSAATSSSKQVGAHTSYWSSLLNNQLFHKDQGRPLVPKPFDLNIAYPEKQNPNVVSQGKIAGQQYHYGCSNGMGLGLSPNMFGSKGVHSNDAIPAMHLLSLVDPGMRSITSPFNAREDKSLKAPSVLQDRRSSSPSVDYKKYLVSETSCDCAFPSLHRNEKNALQSLRKDKAKRRHSPKSGLHISFEDGHGKIQQRFTSSDIPRLQSSCGIVCPIKKSPNLEEICVLNRNPADFTMPGPGNTYMIGPEDVKFSYERELPNANGHKKKKRPQAP